MSFHICAITTTELPNETILDYTFISEENFLLVIALTSKGNLITFYKTGITQKLETISAHEIYHEWCEPVLITITPDASVVILVQSDGSLLMLPIKALIDVNWGVSNNISLIDVNWGVSNNICTAPTLIKIDQNDSEVIFRLPTCVVAFNSRFTNKPYIAYGNKAGKIYIIDLALRMQISSIAGDHSIHNIEFYSDTKNSYILITHFIGEQVIVKVESEKYHSIHNIEFYSDTKDSYILITHFIGAQVIVKVESERCSIRETLSHVTVEEIDSIPEIKYSCQHTDGCLTALNTKENMVNIFSSFESINQQPRSSLKIPENTWLTYFNQKALICVTESNTIWLRLHFLNKDTGKACSVLVTKLDDRLLGIIPVISMSDELDDCFFVTEKQMIVCRPNLSINELALNCIAEEYFSAKMLEEIAKNLQRDPKDMAKTLLRVALEKRTKSTNDECELNGALALTLEVQVEMANIIQILSDFNETDLIIPFLTARCERDPKHWAALLEVYVVKLKRIVKQDDMSEKDAIEEQLKKSFNKCNASKEVFKLLLKQDMWSSQCLSFLLWSNIESLAAPLLTKVCTCLYDVDSPSQLALFANIGETLIPKIPTLFANIGETLIPKIPSPALMTYSIATVRYLHSTQEDRTLLLNIDPVPLATGSNCAVAVGDDDTPYFWGEFTAGSLKFRTETKKKSTNVKPPKSPIKPPPSIIKTTLHPEKLLTPKIHNNESELRIMAVACGTEHVLLLSASGIVYTCGRNRYGQCGTGNKNTILTPIEIHNNYGRAKKIFS
uniref:Uncharacterized protein n=1 Tax=Panagrolaimus sp. PS1159 TaxID=55785 RepID=A0AC35GH93_9BILA